RAAQQFAPADSLTPGSPEKSHARDHRASRPRWVLVGTADSAWCSQRLPPTRAKLRGLDGGIVPGSWSHDSTPNSNAWEKACTLSWGRSEASPAVLYRKGVSLVAIDAPRVFRKTRIPSPCSATGPPFAPQSRRRREGMMGEDGRL